MKVLVTGAGGFIGGHLVNALIHDRHRVVAIDRKHLSDWHQSNSAAINVTEDLTNFWPLRSDMQDVDEVYHLAADMGGMGYIETHKLDCALSTQIDLNLLYWARIVQPQRIFYASSACVYPQHAQSGTDGAALAESTAWPADPEPGYGLQKLYTEKLLEYFSDETGVKVRPARYHNVYGPHGTWTGGREKAPAALCRKVAEAIRDGHDSIEIWGDGKQTRSFMYINDCIEGTLRFMQSEHSQPINIGSSELISINDLAKLVMDIADVDLKINHITGPLGVRGRNSDNTEIQRHLGWQPNISLRVGMEQTYEWIAEQVRARQE